MKKCHSHIHGFTLIELMVVVAIIAILSSLSVGVISVVGKRNRMTAAKADIDKIQLALEQYYSHFGLYPPSNEDHTMNNVMYGALTGDTGHDGTYTPGKNGDIDMDKHRLWRGPYLPIHSKNTRNDGNVKDPWGNPYRYYEVRREEPNFKINQNSFLLYSCGPDMKATDATREEAVDFTLPNNKDNIKNWEDE